MKEKCDSGVYKKGVHVYSSHSIEPEKFDVWVRKVAKESGQQVDWYYFGGTAVVKALGDIEKVRAVIQKLEPEHQKLMDEVMIKALGSKYPAARGRLIHAQ